MREIGTLLAPLGLQEIGPGGGGADIGPIAQAGKVPDARLSGRLDPLFHDSPHAR